MMAIVSLSAQSMLPTLFAPGALLFINKAPILFFFVSLLDAPYQTPLPGAESPDGYRFV